MPSPIGGNFLHPGSISCAVAGLFSKGTIPKSFISFSFNRSNGASSGRSYLQTLHPLQSSLPQGSNFLLMIINHLRQATLVSQNAWPRQGNHCYHQDRCQVADPCHALLLELPNRQDRLYLHLLRF